MTYVFYRILDALCWKYEDRVPGLANVMYDWLERRGLVYGV